ncbi:MAG: FAD-dependent oxidoreductase [Candidatus Thiodiazotropha sp. (ex Lucina aurantia)]|uniref:FAD-dependent oxidoreductase n=2 Tax=Candidatus Thiodiazotropha TaxID=1913444 RepID=A0A9E4NL95_9GAMM|nr:FAD-dependent oxidoreductase [Candidatus Thiodiazotropha endolucinida]MBT3012686.1 FAD-dependent oxidoreductase [Candidatus Thiodiazotropha sp. (ex Lucina pensylvanica)]MBT3015284.1 FAD-dependent oxidoreductase [Candidatus Thiodiazotropha taylori]MBT3043159.1 FAD-dependent oxidoreductase [Candidatus Thiodiazotropha sp. (ex Codakia orbicularis)]MBV2101414.1 FAD-dependent oxidoreductase [Candidatus Thiodiazotropha sp. (ex Lucina aurantia)]MCU7943812.1 FAD-dependent oxidoreductase [Candidatus 
MTEVIATNETILVVGGGISGMTAALEAAETGKQVVLVEKRPYVGGRVTQLYKYFPKLCFPTCGLEINQRRAKMNPNLNIITMAEVTDIKGEAGNYTATVKISPRYVNENCTACGDCAKAVETEFDDEFNYEMGKRKGAYLPHRMAHPQRYVLDPAIIGTDDAQKAKDACKVNAIDLDMQEETIEFKAGAVVWATGWKPYDANKIQPYGYDRIANVITSVEFERMADPNGPTGGKLVRPSDGKEVKSVAFIQCAGSRDKNHLLHCSRICCMASLKQATYPADEVDISIYYIDIRAIDRFEDFYQKVKAKENVSFIKSKVASIVENKENGNPTLHGVDTEGYNRYANEHDLVVLAVGMEPSVDKASFPVEIVINEEGFIEPAPENGGVFAAGCSSDALDVNRAVQHATGAALRAIQVVNRVAATEG